MINCVWVLILIPQIWGLNFGYTSKSLMAKQQLQIDPEGRFDIIERPEQFITIDKQIVSHVWVLLLWKMKIKIEYHFKLNTGSQYQR